MARVLHVTASTYLHGMHCIYGFRVEPEARAHWGEKELKMDEDTQT